MNATDRTTRTWITAASAAAVTGGLCWVAKQGVIAASLPASGGPPPESLWIAVPYLLGAALMALSGSGLVALVTAGWLPVLRVAAAVVVSPMIFWVTFTLVDMVVDTVAGPEAAWWWPGEGAILLTGLIFAAAGAVALARRRTSPVPVPSRR
jgi:hypothetical protein